MPLINYDAYLEGDEWPSESGHGSPDEHGRYQPEMRPIYDMPPQYAASALHKLVRWARDGSMNAEQEDREERRVRSSTLGRLLARKALGIEDFELYSEHGVDRNALSAKQLSRHIAMVLLHPEHGIVEMDGRAAGQLAYELATGMIDAGLTTYKEG